jgi:putative phosphoesterase
VRLAIYSDVHGNRHALEAVLTDIANSACDATYCLGDLVGYGAFPNEVAERVRANRTPAVIGNYDDGVGFEREDCGCAYRHPLDRELGERSFAWTKARVTAENKAYLRTLLKEIRFAAQGRRVLLVHGSPRRLNEYLFEDRPISSFQRLAASSNADVIVFGHTHKPYVKSVDGVTFVNAGSVGKPKDGDWRACYAILDLAKEVSVTFQRVAYDVEAAAAAIRATDLPGQFASDIETGGRS